MSLDMIMDKCCHSNISLTNTITRHDKGQMFYLDMVMDKCFHLTWSLTNTVNGDDHG